MIPMIPLLRKAGMFLVLVLVLVACGGGGLDERAMSTRFEQAVTTTSPTTTETMTETITETKKTLRPVAVAFPYIPNIQFAPYYVAASKGYYTDAGLDVSFQYMYENEAVQLLAQGNADFGFFSGISVMLARQNDIPLVTVATITQEFPVVFFSKGTESLQRVADLKDKRIGLPGRFGASYYGLLAVLFANNLKESDLDLQDIGFNQVQMLSEGKVDVAIGYAMNEPVQLREMGESVAELRVADIYPLASDGIVTTRAVLEKDPELVRSFVAATLKGVQDILANPDEAFTLSLQHIPEVSEETAAFQRKVFDASIPYWKSETLGTTNPQVWEKTRTFLAESGLLTKPAAADESYTNAFLPQ